MQVHLLDVHSAHYEKSDLSACTRHTRRISLSIPLTRKRQSAVRGHNYSPKIVAIKVLRSNAEKEFFIIRDGSKYFCIFLQNQDMKRKNQDVLDSLNGCSKKILLREHDIVARKRHCVTSAEDDEVYKNGGIERAV